MAQKESLVSRQINKDYEKLISQIGEIDGMIFFSNQIFKQYMNLKKDLISPQAFYIGKRFSFYSPFSGRLVMDGINYEVTNKNLKSKTNYLKIEVNNLLSVKCYEFFESFLLKVTSRITVKHHRRALIYDERLGFQNFNSCKMFLSSQYRNNLDLFRLLRFLIPKMDEEFKTKREFQKYYHFYRAFTLARHCIVHSDGMISEREEEKLGHKEKIYMNKLFGISEKNKRINTVEENEKICEYIGELAYLIIMSFEFKIPRIREF